MTANSEKFAAARLADKLASLSVQSLSGATVELARQRIFDTLGAAAAGWDVAEVDRVGEATGWGDPGVVASTRRLCAAARASEVDDIHAGSCTTAGSVAVPVSLAVGDATDADDRAVLAGVISGYETMIRVGQALDGANVIYRGVWTSYLSAPLGAAAATSAVLGLDTIATRNALAIAGTRMSGVSGTIDHRSARWLAFGCAAADGVLAAFAAANGLEAAPDTLERAAPRATRVDFELGRLCAGLRDGWAMEEVDAKPFLTSRQAMSAIEAARRAVAELDEPARLERVVVRVPAQCRNMVDRPDPVGRQTAGSVQFQIAAALTEPRRLYDVARFGARPDDRLRALMRKVEVTDDPELTDVYPTRWGAVAEARSATGEETRCRVLDPLGSRARPLDWDALMEKHERLSGASPDLTARLHTCRQVAAGPGDQSAPSLLAALPALTVPHEHGSRDLT